VKIDKEFQSLIFPLANEERALLEKNIIRDGCRDALVVWEEENTLLDGHNRYEICTKNQISYKSRMISLTDRVAALDWIDSNQLGRRNLSPDMMRLLRGRLYNRTESEQGKRNDLTSDQNDTKLDRAKRIARSSGVSAATVKRDAAFARDIEAKPELMKAIRDRVPIKKIEKEIRTAEIKKERTKLADKARALPKTDRWCVDHGDIATYKTDKKFDYIITDPPYLKEFVPLYDTLASRAKDFLKPNGLLICMCGQSYLDEIYALMAKHLEYYWTAAYLLPGQPTPLRTRQVNCCWKPLLMWTLPNAKYKGKIFGDVFTSDANDKSLHKWGQSESGMLSIISQICVPGESILDPFAGASTTGISAYRHGCIYYGIDLSQENVDISNGRYKEVCDG
jgi:16S rRNA G966 N2-methylase RsmD